MTDSTSIFELPSDPTAGGNISMNINDRTGGNDKNVVLQGAGPGVSLDQTTINQIVNGLQQASSTGATLLPSRDIPTSTQHLVYDAQIQPNYIPPLTEQTDYIETEETKQKMVDNYNESLKKSTALDQVYDEIQTPLLLAILYFLFQLPILRKQLFRYLPFLFLKDGNPNVSGYLFLSSLYGLLFYVLNKSIKNFYI
jgi:hypothetical protein